jgi:hypothetical protein
MTSRGASAEVKHQIKKQEAYLMMARCWFYVEVF